MKWKKKYRKNEMEKIKSQKQKYITDNKLIKNLKSENELLNKRIQRDKEIIDSLRSQLSQYQNQNKVNKIIDKNNLNNYEFQQLDNNNLSLKKNYSEINQLWKLNIKIVKIIIYQTLNQKEFIHQLMRNMKQIQKISTNI